MALLKKIETDFGTIRVTRAAHGGGLAYYQNGSYHSQANRNGVSLCAYIHVMQEILRQARARDILILGGAGGTLATMLRRLHRRVTVVDINPAAFAIARRYFRLPENVRCIRRDGIAYLRATKERCDAVVIDVFGARNAVPRPFTTETFFHAVREVLPSPGVMIMNVMAADDGDGRADRIAHRAQAAGWDITMFDWPGGKDRNMLIAGGLGPHIRIPSGHEAAWIRPDLRGIIRRAPRKYTRIA